MLTCLVEVASDPSNSLVITQVRPQNNFSTNHDYSSFMDHISKETEISLNNLTVTWGGNCVNRHALVQAFNSDTSPVFRCYDMNHAKFTSSSLCKQSPQFKKRELNREEEREEEIEKEGEEIEEKNVQVVEEKENEKVLEEEENEREGVEEAQEEKKEEIVQEKEEEKEEEMKEEKEEEMKEKEEEIEEKEEEVEEKDEEVEEKEEKEQEIVEEKEVVEEGEEKVEEKENDENEEDEEEIEAIKEELETFVQDVVVEVVVQQPKSRENGDVAQPKKKYSKSNGEPRQPRASEVLLSFLSEDKETIFMNVSKKDSIFSVLHAFSCKHFPGQTLRFKSETTVKYQEPVQNLKKTSISIFSVSNLSNEVDEKALSADLSSLLEVALAGDDRLKKVIEGCIPKVFDSLMTQSVLPEILITGEGFCEETHHALVKYNPEIFSIKEQLDTVKYFSTQNKPDDLVSKMVKAIPRRFNRNLSEIALFSLKNDNLPFMAMIMNHGVEFCDQDKKAYDNADEFWKLLLKQESTNFPKYFIWRGFKRGQVDLLFLSSWYNKTKDERFGLKIVESCTPSHQMMMHLACKYSHTNIVKYLLEKAQIDVNINNSGGVPPLQMAVDAGNYRMIQLLLDNGASIRESRGICLILDKVVKEQAEAMKEYLLSVCKTRDDTNADEMEALSIEIEERDSRMIKKLESLAFKLKVRDMKSTRATYKTITVDLLKALGAELNQAYLESPPTKRADKRLVKVF